METCECVEGRIESFEEKTGENSANACYSCYGSVMLLMSFLHKDVLRFINLGLSVIHESQHVVKPKKCRKWESKVLGNTSPVSKNGDIREDKYDTKTH